MDGSKIIIIISNRISDMFIISKKYLQNNFHAVRNKPKPPTVLLHRSSGRVRSCSSGSWISGNCGVGESVKQALSSANNRGKVNRRRRIQGVNGRQIMEAEFDSGGDEPSVRERVQEAMARAEGREWRAEEGRRRY